MRIELLSAIIDDDGDHYERYLFDAVTVNTARIYFQRFGIDPVMLLSYEQDTGARVWFHQSQMKKLGWQLGRLNVLEILLDIDPALAASAQLNPALHRSGM